MVNPKCKICGLEMELHSTMSGDVYICENYAIDGGRMTISDWEKLNGKV